MSNSATEHDVQVIAELTSKLNKLNDRLERILAWLCEDEPSLTERELHTIKAAELAAPRALLGPELARRAGYPYNPNYKQMLRTLCKLGYLMQCHPGYRRTPKPHSSDSR